MNLRLICGLFLTPRYLAKREGPQRPTPSRKGPWDHLTGPVRRFHASPLAGVSVRGPTCIHTSRAFTLPKKRKGIFSSQFFTTGFVPTNTAPEAAAGFLSCPGRRPGSLAAGCQSRSFSPPGLTRRRQNRPSGRERALPCQNQLEFSCIQMRKIGKASCPPGQLLALEGRSKCPMGPRRERNRSPSRPG